MIAENQNSFRNSNVNTAFIRNASTNGKTKSNRGSKTKAKNESYTQTQTFSPSAQHNNNHNHNHNHNNKHSNKVINFGTPVHSFVDGDGLSREDKKVTNILNTDSSSSQDEEMADVASSVSGKSNDSTESFKSSVDSNDMILINTRNDDDGDNNDNNNNNKNNNNNNNNNINTNGEELTVNKLPSFSTVLDKINNAQPNNNSNNNNNTQTTAMSSSNMRKHDLSSNPLGMHVIGTSLPSNQSGSNVLSGGNLSSNLSSNTGSNTSSNVTDSNTDSVLESNSNGTNSRSGRSSISSGNSGNSGNSLIGNTNADQQFEQKYSQPKQSFFTVSNPLNDQNGGSMKPPRTQPNTNNVSGQYNLVPSYQTMLSSHSQNSSNNTNSTGIRPSSSVGSFTSSNSAFGSPITMNMANIQQSPQMDAQSFWNAQQDRSGGLNNGKGDVPMHSSNSLQSVSTMGSTNQFPKLNTPFGNGTQMSPQINGSGFSSSNSSTSNVANLDMISPLSGKYPMSNPQQVVGKFAPAPSLVSMGRKKLQNKDEFLTPKNVATTSSCHICGKVFDRKSWLERHLSCHNDMRVYRCLWCNSRHKRKDNLLQHLKAKHPVELIKALFEEMSANHYPQGVLDKFQERAAIVLQEVTNSEKGGSNAQQLDGNDHNSIASNTTSTISDIFDTEKNSDGSLEPHSVHNKIIKVLVREGVLSKDLLRNVLNTLVVKQADYPDDIYHVS